MVKPIGCPSSLAEPSLAHQTMLGMTTLLHSSSVMPIDAPMPHMPEEGLPVTSRRWPLLLHGQPRDGLCRVHTSIQTRLGRLPPVVQL